MPPAVQSDPLVSFIVLSYNYEKYVSQTIRSILDQTVQDVEVIVIDDNSKDRSVEVIRSINDSRVRLHVNEQNMGGAWGVNKALSMARGRYIANLDSDDWIDPRKTELQLEFLRKNPKVSIVGSYVDFRDAEGNRHPLAEQIEAGVNSDINFNMLESWIIKNNMCRSSTLLTRQFHDQHGIVESEMVYAADFELWTRALKAGAGIARVNKPLTFYRLHTNNITFANPKGTFFEFAYIMAKNIIPCIVGRSQFVHLPKLYRWIIENPNFAELKPAQRYRLLGCMATMRAETSYGRFCETVEQAQDTALEDTGRSVLALFRLHPSKDEQERLARDVVLYEEARDWWRRQSENWEGEYHKLVESGLSDMERARDWWRNRAGYWESLYLAASKTPEPVSVEPELAVAAKASETAEEGLAWWQDEARRWKGRCALAAQENRLLIERLSQVLTEATMPPAAYGHVRPPRVAPAFIAHKSLLGRARQFFVTSYHQARERHGALASFFIAIGDFIRRAAASARYRLAKVLLGHT
jgi:glycosyltransferase involved in cell wall biosynthesis